MRHGKTVSKLSRTPSHRSAMFRNMVTSLFVYRRIKTTDAKAKELRIWADRLINLAKRGDLHARRQALALIRKKDVVHNLFATAKERFSATNFGYTRIVKAGRRPGDSAPISIIEIIAPYIESKKPEKKKIEKTQPSVETAQATQTTQAAEPIQGTAS